MKKLFFIFFAMSLIILTSCDDDDDYQNVTFKKLQIVDAEVPDTFRFGTTYEILVTYIRPNECTYFQGFDVYPNGLTSREVTAIGAYYADQVCTQEALEVTDMFLFKVIYDKAYTFRFWTGTDEDGNPEYIEKEVVVK